MSNIEQGISNYEVLLPTSTFDIPCSIFDINSLQNDYNALLAQCLILQYSPHGRGAGVGRPIALLLSHQPVNPFKNKKTHTFKREDMGFFVGGAEVLASSPTNYSNRVINELP